MNQQSPARRRVKFDRLVKVRRALHITEYSDDERGSMWYSCEDLSVVKRDAKQTVKKAVRSYSGETDDETLYMRGLENRIPEVRRIIMYHRRRAFSAVFQEQERQHHSLKRNPELIAQAYKEVSTDCHEYAREVGTKDAEVQTAIFQQDDYALRLLADKESSSSSSLAPDLLDISKVQVSGRAA